MRRPWLRSERLCTAAPPAAGMVHCDFKPQNVVKFVQDDQW